MSLSNYVTLALFIFLVLIFLIDYLKKRKEDSLEKSVEKFVEKEPETKERSGVLNWILKRKKNITFFVILLSTTKLFLNYFVYPIIIPAKKTTIVENPFTIEGTDHLSSPAKKADFSVHLENIFSDDLFLFIPSTVFILILVWIFNNKIKAQ